MFRHNKNGPARFLLLTMYSAANKPPPRGFSASSLQRPSDYELGGHVFTKQFGIVFVLLIGLALIGCGSNSSHASNINGTWNASLISGGNSTVLAFGTSLKENSDGSLSVTNFKFTTNSPCFVSGETETGSFTLSGNFNGNVNGAFGMNVQSGDPSGNTLALNGTANGNTVSGTWTLTGSGGCTGNGTFTMTKM